MTGPGAAAVRLLAAVVAAGVVLAATHRAASQSRESGAAAIAAPIDPCVADDAGGWDQVIAVFTVSVTDRFQRGGSPLWYADGRTPVIRRDSWVRGLDWSGQARKGSPADGPMTLITSRHAIACAHAWTFPADSPVVFHARAGGLHTNLVLSRVLGPADLSLITLVSNVPAYIKPLAILPTNFVHRDAGHAPPRTLPGLWYRSNSGRMNVSTIDSLSALVCFRPGSCPDWVRKSRYYEAVATGGDSGGPMFLLWSNTPVFLGAIHSGNVAGPWVSFPPYFEWIQSQIGTNALTILDL